MSDQKQKPKPKANIDNIYYDCLERIFDFLNLESLLNVANTCKRLQIAAAAKFSDEHGKKRIVLFFRSNVQRKIYVEDDDIVVIGLKFQLPFLRCFGSKISYLKFWRNCPNECKPILEQYINQYCADTLTGFDFERQLIHYKPFKNLEKLLFSRGDFGEVFQGSVSWYPNLRHLEMYNVRVYADPRIQPLEKLEKLVIYCDLLDNFPNFVNWFPNLRHLEMNYDGFDLNYIAVNFPHLEHLGITMCQLTMDDIVNLLNANLQLKSLDITIIDSRRVTTSLTMLLNMIRTHRSIVKMKMNHYANVQVAAAELSQLANEHPTITELDLLRYQLTADSAVGLIGQLNSLKRFEFCVLGESQCNRIRDLLNSEWRFEHRRLIFEDDPIYVVVLNRNQ